MNRKLMFSSKSDVWTTPQDFFNKLNQEFNFTLDPCATPKSAKCNYFFTSIQDGLQQDWRGHKVFCNPPYGREIGKWVKKCYEESRKPDTLAVMLIPARTDTKYFHNYIFGKAEIRWIKGRLKFINLEEKDKYPNNTKMSPAPFPSCIVIFRNG